jgi:hypothetical protein
MEFGLIGKKLGHSFSPKIHNLLGDYNYILKEIPEEEEEKFLFPVVRQPNPYDPKDNAYFLDPEDYNYNRRFGGK